VIKNVCLISGVYFVNAIIWQCVCCEQQFSLMKNVVSGTRALLSGQNMKGCMRMATVGTKCAAERLINQ
jgi:hypothetical protein